VNYQSEASLRVAARKVRHDRFRSALEDAASYAFCGENQDQHQLKLKHAASKQASKQAALSMDSTDRKQ